MSTTSTITAIDTQTAAYAPAVVSAIVAAEALGTSATGPQKASAVISAVSQSLESSPNIAVAGIAALVNLGVLIANLLGAFKHKTTAAAPSPASAAQPPSGS